MKLTKQTDNRHCALQGGLDGDDVVLQDALLELLEVVCAALQEFISAGTHA
jgi:hypothetical protein